MTDLSAPMLEETIDIDAPPVRVWSLVSDLARMPRWSPQVVRTIVRGRPVQLGTTTVNINRRGLLVWPTRSEVVRFDPHRVIAFRVKDNKTIWSFNLADNATGGTTLTQRREAPDGVSAFSHRFADRLLGGSDNFQVELEAGMRQTLAKVKVDAEG